MHSPPEFAVCTGWRASTLYAAGEPDPARRVLTDYAHSQADEALELGGALLASIEARTRVLYGLREPVTDEMSRLDYQMVTCRSSPET
ncbi:MAG: hypothetical protein RIC56_21125 [Pseudomonadales bacterium]